MRTAALIPYEAVVRLHGWRLFTGSLFDSTTISVFLNVAVCALASRPAELALGRRSLALLLLLGTAVSAVMFSLCALFLYILFRVGTVLIFRPVASFSGMNLIMLVTLKHHIPDHEVGLAGVKLSLNYAPLSYAGILLLTMLVGQLQPASVAMALMAAQFAWMYMRYLQRNASDGTRGDPSENFSFASFFPPQVQAPISAVSNIAFAACIRPVLGNMDAQTKQPQQQIVNTITQDRASTIDAERRRQRAEKSLDERMAGSASEPAI